MLTGAFNPSGARSAGQEAMAEASDAQEARMARFSAIVRAGCVTTSLGVLEDGAGVQKCLKVENVAVSGGRRPHGFLPSMTNWGRRPESGPPRELVQAALPSS